MVSKLLMMARPTRMCRCVPGKDSLLAICAHAWLGAWFVTADTHDTLPPEVELALAWSPQKVRAPLSIALQLDRRLARIVARTSEVMLGQMRLAWWRDALGKPVAERPRGDAVLDALGEHWAGREAALIAMVDGWEVLVTAETLGTTEITAFGSQRAAFFGALLDEPGPEISARIAAAGLRWALADAAAGVSDAGEQALLVATALEQGQSGGRLPSGLRGLAVLDALARRSLQRGGRPLLEGRGAALVALRAAIFLS
jgi:15-cis-phytoene synthase